MRGKCHAVSRGDSVCSAHGYLAVSVLAGHPDSVNGAGRS